MSAVRISADNSHSATPLKLLSEPRRLRETHRRYAHVIWLTPPHVREPGGPDYSDEFRRQIVDLYEFTSVATVGVGQIRVRGVSPTRTRDPA